MRADRRNRYIRGKGAMMTHEFQDARVYGYGIGSGDGCIVEARVNPDGSMTIERVMDLGPRSHPVQITEGACVPLGDG